MWYPTGDIGQISHYYVNRESTHSIRNRKCGPRGHSSILGVYYIAWLSDFHHPHGSRRKDALFGSVIQEGTWPESIFPRPGWGLPSPKVLTNLPPKERLVKARFMASSTVKLPLAGLVNVAGQFENSSKAQHVYLQLKEVPRGWRELIALRLDENCESMGSYTYTDAHARHWHGASTSLWRITLTGTSQKTKIK